MTPGQEVLKATHKQLVAAEAVAAVALWVSSACLCRTCSRTAGATPMSEEQRFKWTERLFWDLNLLPQMGQSGTPGGGGGAGVWCSLRSKHLHRDESVILGRMTSS